MSDNSHGRPPYTFSNDRPRGGKGSGGGGNRRQEGYRDNFGNNNQQRFNNRQNRGNPNGNVNTNRTIHYQVVMMDDEEYGDALEQRLNSLGHEGWRLIAIDEGRQYVFVQGGD